MSRLLVAAIAFTSAACAVNAELPPPPPGGGVNPPTGAPRQAKGQLPMTGPMKPKTVTAVQEMGGKPVAAKRSQVSASGGFDLILDVGVRYTFVITLEDDSVISLFAADAANAYYSWLPIGNSLDGGLELDFGSVTIVNNVFITTTILLDMDWDEDGVADFSDTDDDNDGIDDANDFDIDGDGIEDDYLDADGDGECDLADDDDDNDGIDDSEDTDDDGDGIDDTEEEEEDIDIDGDGDIDEEEEPEDPEDPKDPKDPEDPGDPGERL